MNDPVAQFFREVKENIRKLGGDPALEGLSNIWMRETSRSRYSYNFTWLGRPIIQFPPDILAIQELIWRLRPDVVVETGVAHGGSLVLSASILELLGGSGRVLGIDVEIRPHNRAAIETHALAKRITLLEGSSVDARIVDQVQAFCRGSKNVLVLLDSNHTHAHVAEELRLYSSLVHEGGYLVVFDTIIEDMPDGYYAGKPWGKGNNPKTAVWAFLKENQRFEIDREIQAKLLITVCPDGFLRCLKNP